MCELVVVVFERARIAGSRKKNPKDLRQTTKSIVRYSFIYKIMVIVNGKLRLSFTMAEFSQMHSSNSEGRSVLLLLNGLIAS